MNKVVLDSSAVLAVLYKEPGAGKVLSLLHMESVEAIVSAVNLCEIHTRLLRDGVPAEKVFQLLGGLELTIAAFDQEDAYATSALYLHTKSLGLSLGDRACLALASRRGAVVWTADKVWKKLDIDVEIELIRL